MTYTLPTTGFSPGPGAPTGPASTIGEVWDASVKAQRDVSNPLSRAYVLGEEYDKRIREVEGATGIRLHHPLRDAPADADYIEAREDPEGGWQGSLGQGAVRKKSELRFHRDLARLAEQHPDKAATLRADASVWDDAYARVRKSEQASGDVTARSPLAVNVPLLGPVDPVGMAGSMFGFFHDPVNVATMLIGPGGSAAKGILWNASRQAVAGAAQQAAIEPFTQAWRAEAGLDFGWRQAAGNILMAGVAGGALDAAGRSAWRGLAGLPQGGTPEVPRAVPGAPANENAPASIAGSESGSEVPVFGRSGPETGSFPRMSESGFDPVEALDAAARRLPEDHPARRAADGDPEATIALAERSMAHSDDPEAMRGALSQFRMETLQEKSVLEALDAADADLAAARRIRMDLGDEIARAAQHVADPDSTPPTRPVIVEAPVLDASRINAPGAVSAPEGALRNGDLDPVQAAALIRERPELAGEVAPTTETARGIHALAALSDAGFARVTAGEVEPQLAALVASSAPPGAHADLIDRLVAARPRDLDHARRLVAEMLQQPADAGTARMILGLDDGPDLGAGRINGPDAVWASEGPTKGARGYGERLGAAEFDEPVGPAAKAQADALRPVEDRVLDAATSPDKPPAPWASDIAAALDDAASEADAGALVHACKLF